MIISTCTNLMIIFRIKCDLFNNLFWEIILTEYLRLMEPIICNSFTVDSISYNKSCIFWIIWKTHWYNRLLWWMILWLAHLLLLHLRGLNLWAHNMRLVFYHRWAIIIRSKRSAKLCYIYWLFDLFESRLHIIEWNIGILVIFVLFTYC